MAVTKAPPGPDWASQLTAWATLSTAIILGLTALVVWRQLRDAKKTRHAALLTDISRRWDEPALVAATKAFARYFTDELVELVNDVYGPSEGGQAKRSSRGRWPSLAALKPPWRTESIQTEREVSAFTELEPILNLWETIAVLQKDGAFSLELVDEMWGAAIWKSWTSWKPAIERLRDLTRTRETYYYFQELAKDLRTLDRRKRLARRLGAILRTRRRGPGKTIRTRVQVWYLLRHWDKSYRRRHTL